MILSDHPDFAPGDVIIGSLRFEEYSSLTEGEIPTLKVRKLVNPYNLDPKIFLGALGMTGLTAYSSFYGIGQPVRGETIFISAASGAVGQVVGQLAKREGLKVIGSVGSEEKLKFITEELDFDGGFDYKKEKPAEALKRLVPGGVDIYYENVGGEMLDAALEAMNHWGRIGECSCFFHPVPLVYSFWSFVAHDQPEVDGRHNLVACGMISQYNNSSASDTYAVKNLGLVVPKRIKLQGFIVADANMGPKYTAEHQENVAKWIHEGVFKTKISTTYGIENGVKGFLGLLKGENFGKAVLEIAPLEEK